MYLLIIKKIPVTLQDSYYEIILWAKIKAFRKLENAKKAYDEFLWNQKHKYNLQIAKVDDFPGDCEDDEEEKIYTTQTIKPLW